MKMFHTIGFSFYNQHKVLISTSEEIIMVVDHGDFWHFSELKSEKVSTIWHPTKSRGDSDLTCNRSSCIHKRENRVGYLVSNFWWMRKSLWHENLIKIRLKPDHLRVACHWEFGENSAYAPRTNLDGNRHKNRCMATDAEWVTSLLSFFSSNFRWFGWDFARRICPALIGAVPSTANYCRGS